MFQLSCTPNCLGIPLHFQNLYMNSVLQSAPLLRTTVVVDDNRAMWVNNFIQYNWKVGRRLEWQRQLEEDNIIVEWAQEDVETLYKLLNK